RTMPQGEGRVPPAGMRTGPPSDAPPRGWAQARRARRSPMHAALRARARYSVPRIRCRGRKCEAIMTRGRWTGGVPSPRPFETHKAAIAIACQAFIDQVLKPRFLAEVRPTEFNYPIDISGRWHGSNYRFIQRYRSGFVDNTGWEFHAPFTRLQY